MLMPRDNHRLTYANEKFQQAIYQLAVGSGPIKERVRLAYLYVLRAWPFEGLSEELAARALALHDALTKVDAEGDEGKLAATLATMSDDEAGEVAREIYDLASDLEYEHRGA
jgi:hypothetical protein